MSKNTLIQKPYTGNYQFGVIPYMKSGHEEFNEGFIQLRLGKHFGPHRGFGVNHIWAEHELQMRALGYESKADVSKFVADLIQPKCPIYFEFNDTRGNHRIAVVKSSLGVAYLEQKYTAENITVYSVVTVFDRRNAYGTKIGAVN